MKKSYFLSCFLCTVGLATVSGLLSSGCEKTPTTKIQPSQAAGSKEPWQLYVKDATFEAEGNNLLSASLKKKKDERIEFLSSYFLGRKYRPDTKKRIKKQRKAEKAPVVKKEATNTEPKPVRTLATNFRYLDCMTYVEHVLALASVERRGAEDSSLWRSRFLNRLIDVMFCSQGKPLMNHHRSHFVSVWAEKNEEKGYLINVAKNHKDALVRKVHLNKVKDNGTFYVEDAFMKYPAPSDIYYFSLDTLKSHRSILQSSDILSLVCSKEGLDVVHMGFFIQRGGKDYFRHASFSDNRIIDSPFWEYMQNRKTLTGLMVLRPVLNTSVPHDYKTAVKTEVKAASLGKARK